MRLPITAHTSLPWRIHELTQDFVVEDVWALPTPGGPGEFPRLVSQVVGGNFPEGAPFPVRFVWAARWKLGALFRLDGKQSGIKARVESLRDRLPEDLRDAAAGQEFDILPFSPVYQLENEWAAELANKTMHGVMHLSWVPDGSGGYRGQMAVLVKPNGPVGAAYMAVIKPIRYILVYPALMRMMKRGWLESARQ